jgi:DNA-binding NtrC family response regulator
MKKVLFYSPDFSLCYSLLVYLQDKYNVTSSTDFNVLQSLAETSDFDLLILDSEPNSKIEKLCAEIKKSSSNLKIVLTYVYDKMMSTAEDRLKNYISAVYYKPFDLSDLTESLPDSVTDSNPKVF